MVLKNIQVSSLANIDGEVSKNEFIDYAKKSEFFKTQMDKSASDTLAQKKESNAKAERAFKLFDRNNDGYLRYFKQNIEIKQGLIGVIGKT